MTTLTWPRRREYERRKRAARWAALAQSASRCPRKHGRGRCGGRLETEIIRGRTVVYCEWCERRERGICRECPRPVSGAIGKALRCEVHKKAAQRRATKASAERNRDLRNRRAKLAARALKQREPEKYRAKQERKRLWRLANPAKVNAWKRKEALSQNPRRLEYARMYRREQRLESKRERERLRAHGALPPRSCLTCPSVVTGRAKKCDACRARAYADAVASLLARAATEANVPSTPRRGGRTE